MIDEVELGRVLDEREALVHVDDADEGVPLQDLRELFVRTIGQQLILPEDPMVAHDCVSLSRPPPSNS